MPLSKEQTSVYHAFLEKFSFLHVTNLSSVTVPFDFEGFPNSRPCPEGMELQTFPTRCERLTLLTANLSAAQT